MTVRVRFAPSPTGHLHIGGARTALYNYLFAKAMGGQFILRVEDTDQERGTKEFEDSQQEDMKWCGLNWDVGPGCEDEHGPYRQSERLDIYQKYTNDLLEKGMAYYDFCTDEELEAMKEKSKEEGTPAYTGKWRDEIHWEEAKSRVAGGEKAPVRFKSPVKDYQFEDKVRGTVKFPAGMVSDFVIMRTTGIPTYNFCNAIDDHLHKISHIIRGEDHVNNTLRQLMIYEAIGATPPVFAHVSLLIGSDRQKLSKRHGATSVNLYRDESYLPESLMNYLCLLGWSHPEEKDIFNLEDLKDIFNLDRFSKSHAIYDIDKLKWVNSQHMKELSDNDLMAYANAHMNEGHFFNTQSNEWKSTCLGLLKEKVQLANELPTLIEDFILKESFDESEELKDIFSWETTPAILNHVKEELAKVDGEFVTADQFSEWMNFCKKELKIKGKPLFMGFRGVLTGQNHGPDLKVLIPLTPVTILNKRLESIKL